MINWGFWFEMILLALIPYPIISSNSTILPMYFSIQYYNYYDMSADMELSTTTYLVSDLMLSLMVMRFYFVVQACLVISPIENLNARRICL